ncbi:MAG: hypothetical protein QXG97_05255 [Nitrososphaerota archaeon]
MEKSEPVSPNSFILRITKQEWFNQVFAIKKYYPGIGRRWEPGGIILLARKSGDRDAFVGYGVLERFVERSQLPEKERTECERMRWKGVLVFNDLFRFKPPLPIKETALGETNARGRCFHGYPLTERQLKSVLDKAREECAVVRID